MKIFQLALIATSAAFEEKSSKKRCEQDVMEEDMKYCEDHNTSLTGCVDWIKEGPAYLPSLPSPPSGRVHVCSSDSVIRSTIKIWSTCVMVTNTRAF